MGLNYLLHENGNIIVTQQFERVIPDKMNGLKQKRYIIDRAQYRAIASSAVNLWSKKKNRVTFFTLTFPFNASESIANECFSKFMDNLKLNHGLQNYIATKERGEQGNKIHFHCLFDLPFVDIAILNKAWSKTYRKYSPSSANCVRLPDRRNGGAVVRSQERCVKYICKYISKSVGVVFLKPCYFISRDILSKPINITPKMMTEIEKRYYIKEFSHEYFTCYTLYTDEKHKKVAYFPKNSQINT